MIESMAITDTFDAVTTALPSTWTAIEVELSGDGADGADRIHGELSRHGIHAYRSPQAVVLTLTPGHMPTMGVLGPRLDTQASTGGGCRLRALSFQADGLEAAEKALEASLRRLQEAVPAVRATPLADRGNGNWSAVLS